MAKAKKQTHDLCIVEKFYIEHNCHKMTLESICEDLKCSPEYAEAYYKECLDKVKRPDTIDKLMMVNSKRGYAIMSKEASERGEATKKTATRPLSEHIHRIRGNK
jgi:hypothetical protein